LGSHDLFKIGGNLSAGGKLTHAFIEPVLRQPVVPQRQGTHAIKR